MGEQRNDDVAGSRSNLSLAPVIARLTDKFGHDHGPLEDEVVEEVVESAAGELSDAPVQAFTEVIAEKNARERLRRMAADAAKATPSRRAAGNGRNRQPTMQEANMALSDELTKLAARAKAAEDRTAAAKGEAKADLEQEVKAARKSAQDQADQLSRAAETGKAKLSAWWVRLQ